MLTQTERQNIAKAFRIPESEDAKIEEIANLWRTAYGPIKFAPGAKYIYLTKEQSAKLVWTTIGPTACPHSHL